MLLRQAAWQSAIALSDRYSSLHIRIILVSTRHRIVPQTSMRLRATNAIVRRGDTLASYGTIESDMA